MKKTKNSPVNPSGTVADAQGTGVQESDPWGPAPNAAEQLRRWDAGESIWSIEMGGLGPGYEQALQILAIEIVRDNLGKPLPEGKYGDWGDSTVTRIACGGFSGAQVGAAKYLAHQWLTVGPAKLHEAHRKDPKQADRCIQVSKLFPQAPEVAQ